jgi:tripartite-type tricarboxylate transporter receptor subunit TctC
MKHSKILAVLPLAALTLAACGGDGGQNESAEEYPSRPIEVIVSFAAGGGTDLGARQLMPLVEKELGGKIQIVNKPGAGGWVGWEELVNAEPDGYTLGYLNTPNLMTGYLNPDMGRDNSLEDFSFIANQVTDAGIISIRTDETRFTDLESLIEYAKSNPVTTTSTGIASDDHIAVLRLNKSLGTQFEAVPTEGASEGKASFLGGHIDVLVNNVGETYQSHEDGELMAIGVMAEERSEFLEDVPTIEEAGFGPIYSNSARGIGAPAGVPDEILNELSDAVEKAINGDEHKQLMSEQGLFVDYKGPADYKSYLETEESELKELLAELGWTR